MEELRLALGGAGRATGFKPPPNAEPPRPVPAARGVAVLTTGAVPVVAPGAVGGVFGGVVEGVGGFGIVGVGDLFPAADSARGFGASDAADSGRGFGPAVSIRPADSARGFGASPPVADSGRAFAVADSGRAFVASPAFAGSFEAEAGVADFVDFEGVTSGGDVVFGRCDILLICC